MSTCNRLDLLSLLGSRLVMPKNLSDHCVEWGLCFEYIVQSHCNACICFWCPFSTTSLAIYP